MMFMLLVFFIATDMKIKVLGELDFVSCFFILLVKAVTLRRLLKKTNLKLVLPFSCHHLTKKRELNPTLRLNKANTIRVLVLMLQLGMHMYKMQSLKSLIIS